MTRLEHLNTNSQHQPTVNHHLQANAKLTTMVGHKVEEEVQEMIVAMNQD